MPEVSQVHIDAALQNGSIGYRNPAFISDIIAPTVPVLKQSDRYYIHDAGRERLRATSDLRAPGARTSETDFALSTDAYFCDDHALSAIIPDEERANADPAIQPAIERTEFLTDKIDLNKELALAARILTGADIPGTTLSGETQWSDFEHSDPVAAVEAQKASIQSAIQEIPNTLVLPYEVFQKIRLHPKITDRVKYTTARVIGEEMLAALFDVERVLIPRAFKNTAPRGQTASIESIWGKNALLCYVTPRPALMRPAFAYTFVWTQAPGSAGGRIVEIWREPSRKADAIRVQRYYDQKIIAAGACYLWKDAVA